MSRTEAHGICLLFTMTRNETGMLLSFPALLFVWTHANMQDEGVTCPLRGEGRRPTQKYSSHQEKEEERSPQYC